MNSLKIIIPCYNCEEWIAKTIESIKTQDYENFECIIIDDISTDSTSEVITDNIKDDSRFTFVKNKEKKYALKNIIDGIGLISKDKEDIIITVDGDDWLYNNKVFSKVVECYEEHKCLITYGCFVEYPTGITHPYYMSSYNMDVLEKCLFRDVPWKASHLRTFKKKLFDLIKEEDMIDPATGKHYDVAWDLVFMYPMLEMAGIRSRHIPEILYVYNKENPLSDMYIKEQQQLEIARQVRCKPKYERVDFET